jgi:hypothetical protein
VYEKIKRSDELCISTGIKIEFAPESTKFELFTSESVWVIYPEPLTKSDVLALAKAGRVFPCKTTRHIVPARPMGVYFPLVDLRNSSLSDCLKKLEKLVNSSPVELEDREVWYEGRRYTEPLAIFRRQK